MGFTAPLICYCHGKTLHSARRLLRGRFGHMTAISKREFFSFFAAALRGQWSAQQDPTFQSDVRVINILASVRNSEGEIQLDLRRDVFSLEIDGHNQSIDYFDHPDKLGVSVAVLIDISGSMRKIIDHEIGRIRLFAAHFLKGGVNDACLVTFARGAELLRAFTSAPLTFMSSLNRVAYNPGVDDKTTLFDAISVVASRLMSSRPGRRAILLVSDGVDAGSHGSLNGAIEQAQRVDAAVYALHVFDPDPFSEIFPDSTPDARYEIDQRYRDAIEHGWTGLQQICERTGGRAFPANHSSPSVLTQMEEELGNQYSFGFNLTSETGRSGTHKVRITTIRPDLTVRAKDSYYVRK
jgi:VWFA-related protein